MGNKKINLGLTICIMSILAYLIINFVFLDIFNTPVVIPVRKQKPEQFYIKPIKKVPKKNISVEQVKYGVPIHLKIPKINVDISLEPVSLTSKGEMDVPKSFYNAWWFHLGPRPGEKWIAVIDWHFGWKKGVQSVFNNLHKLHKWDKIFIEDEKWIITTFIVSELKSYKANDNTTDVFISTDEKSHLNLITCQWVWDKNKKSYPDRFVVFSEKEIK